MQSILFSARVFIFSVPAAVVSASRYGDLAASKADNCNYVCVIAVVSQTNIGTLSKATSGKLLRDGVERIWAFPRAYIPS